MKLKPAARKYRFDEVPPERERWLALPLEVRLRAVVEMAEFWARVRLEEAQARGEAPTPPSVSNASTRWRSNDRCRGDLSPKAPQLPTSSSKFIQGDFVKSHRRT